MFTRINMRIKIKNAMKDMLQRNCICDYTFVQDGKEIYQKNMCAIDAYMKTYDMSANGNIECYMTPEGIRALRPVFTIIDGTVILSGQIIQ